MTGLPHGWEVTPLTEIARLGSGGTPQAKTPAYYGGHIPWAVIGDLNDGVVTRTQRRITPTGLVNSSAKVVPVDTVLLAMYGSIGKLGITGEPMATNQAIATIKPTDRIDVRYLFYYLLAQRRDLDAAGKGATQRNISQTVLKPWPVRFPTSLAEQRRIVDLLDDHLSRLDAAQDGLAKTRKRLVSLERSALDAHFGAAESTAPLGDLIENISAGKSFGAASAQAQDDQWGIIKVSAMTWGAFKPEENKAVPPDRVDPRFEIHEGDLLVSRANTSAYVGASVLVGPVRPKLLLSDKSLRVVPKDGVRPEWLLHALQAPSARRQISALATGTKDSMRNISQASLLRVLLPAADETEQARAIGEFAAIDEASRRLAREVEATDARLRHLRRVLMAAAFSGSFTGTGSDLSELQEMISA